LNLAVLLLELKFSPYFSISYGEAYQYKPSYILPPPSTLLGALGRSLTIYKNIGYPKNLEILREIIIDITATPLSPAVKVSTLLTRLRIESEKGMRKDAMVREYISLHKLLCIFLLNMDNLQKKIDENTLLKISNSIDRIGDTESLCSVILSKITSAIKILKERVVEVNTYVRSNLLESASGDYMIVKMPSLEGPEKTTNVYLPICVDKEKPSLYIPTRFQATLNEKSQAILVENKYTIVTGK
jgi:CRISPR-associated protein Cas5 subtype I-A